MGDESKNLELWDKVIDGLKSLDAKDENILFVPKRTMRRLKWRYRLSKIFRIFKRRSNK